MRSTRIGSFKDFVRKQRKKKINEQKLEIQCDFWDAAQVEVVQDLTDQCDGCLNYDNLIKFVKGKYQILGKDEDAYPEAMLLAHIKDLIFSHHWNSLFCSGGYSWGDDNSGVQAKGLV